MDKTGFRKSASFITVCFISLVIFITHFNLPRYNDHDFSKELTYDVTSYYLYLPMSLIFHDPGMKTSIVDSLHSKYKFSPTLYQIHNTENQTRVPNYTCGMSYFYLPFFLVGHLWALKSSYLKDGFSLPYQLAISIGIYLFIIPGLFILRKVLIQWFSETVVSLTMLILCFGTNYFSEATSNYLQPHAALFSLYTVLLLFTKKWHDKPSFKSAAIIGFVAGWITLARPTDIICILIPILWGVYDKKTLIAKFHLLKRNIKSVLILIIAGIIPFIPQFIYWKITTGNFYYYSYKHTEGFDFLSPHIWNVLFSFKKSLFIYTPLLLIPLAGLFYLNENRRDQKYFIILFTIINFYLLSSWAVWWDGASFGMRYFVQSYAVLSIPFCVSIQKILNWKRYRYLIFLITVLFIFLNLFQTWQFTHWILPEDRMNFSYYKKIFLKTNVTEEDKKYMETFRSQDYTESFTNENDYNHYVLAYYNFEDINATPIDTNVLSRKVCVSSPNSCRLSETNMYYPTYRIKYDNLIKGGIDHVWLRVTFNYYSDTDIRENPASLVINFPHNKYNLKYRAYDLDKLNGEKGKWNTARMDYMTPYPYSEKDNFEIYMWYRGKTEMFIDNFKIEVFEPNLKNN